MWSPLLWILIAVTSQRGALGYVSGPNPMYERANTPALFPLPESAGAGTPTAAPAQRPRRPLQRPGVLGLLARPGGEMRRRQDINNRPIRARDANTDGMIHFPVTEDKQFSRSKRQVFPNFNQNQPHFSPGSQDFFNNGAQNNFGNSFDYPMAPTPWGNGNGNGNRPRQPSRQNFNAPRPGQQRPWGNPGGNPGGNSGGGSPDYEEVPLIFDNAPQTPRPTRPRPSRPAVGTANNNNNNNNNRRPATGSGQPPQQFPQMTRPPVTPPPVTPPPNLPPTAGTTIAGCNCPTTPEFNPVCGEDRVTYFNAGRLRCSNLCGNRVQMLHLGSCIATTTAAPATPASAARRRQG